MLKSKRQTRLDAVAAEAKPEVAEQSSQAYGSTIARLRARRDQVEDRLQQIADERRKLMVEGADDAVIDRLRQEHCGLEVEVDDIEAAIRLAEQRREAALVRERRVALEVEAERLKAEIVPGMLDGYRKLYEAAAAYDAAAEFVVEAERQLRGHNATCVERKRLELRVSCDARQQVSDEVAGVVRAGGRVQLERMKGESDAALALRQGNADARRREQGSRTNVFFVLGKRMINHVLRLGLGYDDARLRRVQITSVQTFAGPDGSAVTKHMPLLEGGRPLSHPGLQRDGSVLETGLLGPGNGIHRGAAVAKA
jgi:hypothetical protein